MRSANHLSNPNQTQNEVKQTQKETNQIEPQRNPN
ncbi:hypothetical protein BVRB_9g225430 [Beta vulgaris subsp. vulgaris]|uniref:Uncharacterized protein n=1 Tax=Beta vulgaris subsp. vulgaris TaxID=3555 RepID=A0A0J8B5W9_BETVV|nr:hypothetical protein BVRB_9g225430 [Beta vulgaris subsp. vulgaris]